MTLYIGIAGRADSDWVKAIKGRSGLVPRPPREVVSPQLPLNYRSQSTRLFRRIGQRP